MELTRVFLIHLSALWEAPYAVGGGCRQFLIHLPGGGEVWDLPLPRPVKVQVTAVKALVDCSPGMAHPQQSKVLIVLSFGPSSPVSFRGIRVTGSGKHADTAFAFLCVSNKLSKAI